MSLIKNLKIGAKLGLGFGLVLALVLMLALYAINALSSTANKYQLLIENPFGRFLLIEEIDMTVTDMRHQVALIALNVGDTADINRFSANVTALQREFAGLVSDFRDNVRNDDAMEENIRSERIRQITSIEEAINRYVTNHVTPIIDAARRGDEVLARRLVNDSLPNDDAIDVEFEALSNAILSVKDAELTRNETSTRSSIINKALVTAAIFLGSIIIALVITRLITKPIATVVSAIKEVSHGNLNVNIRVESKDETGMLTQNALDLIAVVRNIVDDLSKAYTQYMVKGDMQYSIPLKGYDNSFEEVVKSVNTLLQRNTDDLNDMKAELLKISDGDFTVKMEDSAWPGDWADFPKTVNTLTANLNGVSQEIRGMVVAASREGNLSYTINDAAYKGDWRKVMSGLNAIAEAANAPIVEIRDVMGKISKGDFKDKINGNYAGDFLAIKNAVNGMLDSLTGYMDEVAETLEGVSKGDLTRHITREYLGEFSRLKNSLNNITDTLYKTMNEISVAADQVLSGAKQISTSAMDLANGAQAQASSIEELNASIDIIHQQTQRNADNAVEASTLSNKSAENANKGNESMKQMLHAMEQIKDSSSEISKIIKAIQDITFQTNLLSLNASVEAARAGEHGRGFAVVADEVRNLASKSQKSTVESTALISESITRVDAGSAVAETTSESLAIIVKNAAEVLAIVDNISNSSKEQAESISQISQGLAQISSVVQSNSAVSEETAAASEELNSQAEVMRQLVSYFKL